MKSNAAHPSKKADPVSAYYRARERLWEANRDPEIELTTRVRNTLESTLETGRRPAASVRLSLWEQRKNVTPLLHESKSRTDHILEQQKGEEGVSLRVYLERAFADPSDYRFPSHRLNAEEKKTAIYDIILNPSHIPDPLFLDLTGIEETDWEGLSPTARLERKRKYMPKLKELFAGAQLLQTSEKGATGRIVRLPFHKDMPKVAGSYLVFQELPSLDYHRPTARNPRTNPVSVKVLPDIWSLSRSQLHATESLADKIKLLNACREELTAIRMNYSSATETGRREMIAGLTEKFNEKHAYIFRKIITIRKPKLRYVHLGVDEAVLLGMQNDLNNYYQEIVSKQSQIFRQSQLLRSLADGHTRMFFGFLDAFNREFANFDGAEIEKRLHPDTHRLDFTSEEARKIGHIWHVVRTYACVLTDPVSIGEPFYDVENRVLQAVKVVKRAPAKTNVRELLKLVVQMKLGAYRILLRQMDDTLQVPNRFAEMRTGMAMRTYTLIELFESLQFLKSVKLGKKFDMEFSSKLGVLREILKLMTENNVEGLKNTLTLHLRG